MIRSTLAIATLALLTGVAQAAAVVPAGTFGDLTGATFKMLPGTTTPVASGIPATATMINTTTHAGGNITIGLTAHGRYDNPPTGNNGAGTFTAGPGSNTPAGASGAGALWNFGFYVDVGSLNFGRVNIDLLYDLDPGVGTDETLLGRMDLDNLATLIDDKEFINHLEDSQNLLFSYLSLGVVGGVTPPAFTAFDPNAFGEYSFVLKVSDESGNELVRSAMLVNVVGANRVPEPGTLALVGLALAGAATLRRRKS